MGNKIKVLVTGIGGGGNGEQILKALRASELDYHIVGCDAYSFSKGIRDVDSFDVVPRATERNYIETLRMISWDHNVKAIFPGSEPELLAINRNREIFESAGIFLPINPESVITTCMNKSKTATFLKQHGFFSPRTMRIDKVADISKWDIFPAILKPSVGSGGSANTHIVQERGDLELFGAYLLRSMVCSEIIVQEYVGTPDQEYTVGVLHDMNGIFINSIAVKRDLSSALSRRLSVPNRTGTSEFGPNLVVSSGISQGEIGPFPEITKTCEEIAAELGVCGAINIQCRYYKGKVHVFEINPRFSGTTSLRALVGYNEPDVLIRKHILKEQIQERFPYVSGIIMRGLDETYFEIPGGVL